MKSKETGRSRGFGFVEFSDYMVLDQVIADYTAITFATGGLRSRRPMASCAKIRPSVEVMISQINGTPRLPLVQAQRDKMTGATAVGMSHAKYSWVDYLR